ncbi:MAG: hypothetical protein VW874_02450 [Gammaproteobacteria bacterium]|jgi:hypothetical protein
MKMNKTLEAVEPRQIKAVASGIIAVVGLTLALIAFGVACDHGSLAKQVVEAVSHGPVGDVVNAIYIK